MPKHKHTSVKKRINALKHRRQPQSLMPFIGNPRANQPVGIAFDLKDYLELVDATGRIIRHDKRGSIDETQSTILTRLGIDGASWLELTTAFEKHFCYAAGSEQMMRLFGEHTHHQRIRGKGDAKKLLSSG